MNQKLKAYTTAQIDMLPLCRWASCPHCHQRVPLLKKTGSPAPHFGAWHAANCKSVDRRKIS